MYLIVNKMYYPEIGGVEVVAKTVADLLSNYARVTVLTFNNMNKLLSESINGVRVVRIPSTIRRGKIRYSLSYTLYFQEFAEDSNTIIFNFPAGQPELYSSLYKKNNAKKICIYHNDIAVYGPLGNIYNSIFVKSFLNSMDRIIVTSPKILESSKILREFKEKSVVVPLFVDTNHFYPRKSDKREEILKMFKHLKVEKVVMYIGRIAPYKGLQYLVEAMNKVDKNIGLVIIGNGPVRKRIENLIKNVKLTDRVVLLDHVPYSELPSYYSAADVFVLPSITRGEAFGLVVVEAMACGTPVITTELGTGTSYHNINGETGLVVPPRDSGALATAIREICENNWKQLKKDKIIKRAHEFSLENFEEKFLKVLNNLV